MSPSYEGARGTLKPLSSGQTSYISGCIASCCIIEHSDFPQFPFSTQDYVDIMEALADSAGLSLLPFGTADVGPVPTRFDSLSDKLEDRAKCVNLADIEQWQEEMRNLQGWMWNGPLLPCHYRLSEILSKHDISHAPAKSDERSTFLDVGYGGGGRLGDEREVLLRALAEIRDANTKLQSGVDLST